MTHDNYLLEQFVATFARLDDLSTDASLDPVAWQLAVGEHDQYGLKHWEPAKVETPRSQLDEIYKKLPARFPPLYESLVLSYRWAEVDLGMYRLVANPPGPDLYGLFEEISKDQGLWSILVSAGLIQFGKGPDVDYDPLCFDSANHSPDGDCRVVKLDHEEILVNRHIRVISELAPSFHELVIGTIDRANRRERSL